MEIIPVPFCDCSIGGMGYRVKRRQDARELTARSRRSSGRGRGSSDSRLIIEFSTFAVDVPFELVRKVSSPGSVAEACHVEGCSAATRHVDGSRYLIDSKPLLGEYIVWQG
jgi:hypothetical protein